MSDAHPLVGLAEAIGQPSRAAMLAALLDECSLPASELAFRAGVTGATASAHLSRLAEAGLVRATRYGRHQYYRLSGPEAAAALRALLAVPGAGTGVRPSREPEDGTPLRACRSCYDHMAGRLGVAVTEALVARGALAPEGDHDFIVTSEGWAFLGGLGLPRSEVEAVGRRRGLARACLDWSERRPHVAGRVGHALLRRWLDLGWVRRRVDGRALDVAETGRSGFAAILGVRV